MADHADAVVAGAGLAGACAALVLSRTRRVVVLDAGRPGGGASAAAAGLANPFMGRAAKPAWRHDLALDALAELAAEADPALYRRTGIVRPAVSDAQADAFRQRARAHGDVDWLGPEASAERWPAVAAPRGALHVRRGGSVDLVAFVEAALAVVEARGGRVVRARLEGWIDGPVAITDHGEIRTPALVLALGDGARELPSLAGLPVHRVKGQTVRLGRPPGVPADHPAVAGAGYAVPAGESVIVGSTFEHTFADLRPDPSLDAGLVARAAALVAGLAGAPVLERRAGVRLTVPSAVSPGRLPLAGPLAGAPGVWVLTGLGAKGLMTAPMLARWLPAAVDGRRPFPDETSAGLTV